MKRRIVVVCFVLAVASGHAAPSWTSLLTAEAPAAFPPPPDFAATWTFGWSGFPAAEARTAVSTKDGVIRLKASGGTRGAARFLWQLDARLESESRLPHFATLRSEQVEDYARRTIRTSIVARDDGLWRLRDTGDPAKSRWKRVKISPVRDLFSGMLFIRSQPLGDGDRIGLVIYPGDSPFLVEATVAGHEPLTTPAGVFPAIRLRLSIQRINLKKDGALEAHGKFRSGDVWLSDDADRLPLRAEVDLFIGYVFAERTSLETPATKTAAEAPARRAE